MWSEAWLYLWHMIRRHEINRRYAIEFPHGCSCYHGGNNLHCECNDIVDAVDGKR